MAISVVDTNETKNEANGATGITITHGFTLADGDVLHAWISRADDDIVWGPSGTTWAQLEQIATATGNDNALALFRRVIADAGSEPSDYTFVGDVAGNTRPNCLILMQLRGVDTTTPEDAAVVSVGVTNDFTPTPQPIDVVTAGALVVVGHAASMNNGVSGKTGGAPTGYTLIGSGVEQTSSGLGSFLEVAYKNGVAAGTETPGAFTGTPDDATSEYRVFTVAVRPAAGGTTHFGTSALALTLTIVTAAFKTTFGMAALAVTFGITTVGRVTAFGSSTLALTFGSTANGTRTTFGASAMPLTFAATIAGTRTTFGAASLPLTFNITTRSGASSYFGSSSLGLTLGVTTEGRRGIGGASSLALTFGSTTAGERTARGTVSLALTLGIVTSGIRSTFGAASLPLVLTITTAAAEPPEALLYPEAAPGRLVTQPTFGVLDTYPTSGVLDRPDAVTLER